MQDLPRILLSVESSRGFGRDLLTGISNFTRIYNPWTISRKPPFFRYGNVDKFDFDTIKNDLDGIITRIPEEIPIIQKLGIPAIVATVLLPPGFKLDPHYPTITSNNEAIAQVAMDYFISQGFSRVAYCGFGDVSWSLQRREAFKSYAKEMGYDVLCYDPPAESSWEEEIQIIGDWLKVLPKPVAVLACSDDRGEDIIEAAKISRVRIPEEVAVLGIDDDNLICNLSNPTLSSVVLNTQKTGFQAAELLNRLINGEETMTGQRLLLQPLYVEARQSTDILAIEDPEVACALGFIRQKAREAIQVQDVVNAAHPVNE
jgi:LacI family transcriptional regulator